MKQYIIDELRLLDYHKIKNYFDNNYMKSGIDGIYWIKLNNNLLSDIQKEHQKCKPFYFAINIKESKISCELLIYSMNQVQCSCIGYANLNQRNWIIKIIDDSLKNLKIIT